MTDEIKKRVTHLQNKEIPSGYKKTKAGIMPVDWDGTIKAKQVFKSHTDKKHDGNLEILAATQENGIVPRSQIDIDIKCSEEGVSGYKRVKVGDFIISLRSFQGGIEYSQYDGIVSPAYTVLEAIRPICDVYYRNYFKTSDFINRLNGAVYGIRDGKQIGYEDFGDLLVHYPPLPEQEKIAEVLLQCDKVIELKRQRIEAEHKKKRWLMENLLNPNGSVRLAGFSGGWKKSMVGSVAQMFSGGTPTSSNRAFYADAGIPFIRSGEIAATETELFLSQGGFDNSSAKMVRKGDLLYALYGANSGECAISKIDGAINQAILCIRSNIININFLYYALSYMKAQIVSTYLQGGQGNLSGEIVKNLSITFPNMDEQEAICSVLNAQDTVIEKWEMELTYYLQKKKALMQLLLTGIVRVNLQ